ncbi:unnamed protein product [Mytilus edulis]|uniref:Tyr recombinase domain-containing protein n=1 Tax=Mytilus edulis TaxID=6550 RepID=A0A8S3SEA6_MYTED|nr:unnamed protein product [Mytilus edulis]
MGGRKTSLNRLAKQIWLWCMHRKIWLSVFFIKGKLNIKADALSRQKLNADMEWMIVDKIFAQIMDKFGPCDIDLFASKYNYRLDKYVSFGPDVKAFACIECCITENLSRKSNCSSDSSVIFDTTLVSCDAEISMQTTLHSTKSSKYLTKSKNKSKSSVKKYETGSFHGLREKLCERGLSKDAANIIIGSWRESTQKQYGSYIQKWMLFCNEEKINQFNPSINNVLKFLFNLFENGLGYSALNTAKSAVSSFVYLITNVQIGKHVQVKTVYEGIFNKRPSLPKYNVTWNIEIVLKFLKSLKPVKDISLKKLTLKLVMLLALTTGQRIQSLFLIDIRNLELGETYVKIRYGDLLKQTRPGYQLSELFIEAYKPDYRICVVYTLNEYLERTAALRNDVTQLFVSHQKTAQSCKKCTIASWIKKVLALAGIDMTIFSPHSTRGACTSYEW